VPLPSLPPVHILELNCVVHDDDHHHIFPVKIAGTESVGTLKKLIKEAKKPAFDHVTADSLRLWNVSIPVDDDFKENVGKFELSDEGVLSPVDVLSEVFSVAPVPKRVHIIVLPPPARECEYLIKSG
jgi:hypothetical protein